MTDNPAKKPNLTYKEAGVDIEAGEAVVELIRKAVQSTYRSEVLTDIGGFGGLFELGAQKYKNPVLVSGTDGVGTKLKIAQQLDIHNTVGIDLVAMCVNDILVQGAEPLFFLDYFATGALEPHKTADVIKGIAEGCRQAGCALLGGETAEMPGFYAPGEYDLAGFAVGAVERDSMITGDSIETGDVIFGLASSGVHSNGYSLVRKLIETAGLSLDTSYWDGGKALGQELLEPTRIYVKAIRPLLDKFAIKGLVHITGGGLTQNTPRVLPEGVDAELKLGSWPIPPIFKFIQTEGGIELFEMLKTFNMGIGMLIIVAPNEADALEAELNAGDEAMYRVGSIINGMGETVYV